MVGCAESGDFRSFRLDNDDRGKFTVHATDAPFAPARRKKQNNNKQQTSPRKNCRLTPITELEERASLLREESFSPMSIRSDDDSIPISPTLDFSLDSSPLSTDRSRSSNYLDGESPFHRSDTPRARRKSTSKILLEVSDHFEDELSRIPEDNNSRDDVVRSILAELPPRPKCRRKVLPPSFESDKPVKSKPKRKKLLKLRNASENDKQLAPLRKTPRGSEKQTRTEAEESAIQDIVDKCRPKSAGSGVRVVKLADLSSVNSASVPDLPSIIDKLSKYEEDCRRPSETFDDNGALSTPRSDNDETNKNPLAFSPWNKACLKGSDMSSFYNMWERDRKKRPFDKRHSDKSEEVSYYRSCMCSLKNCAKKCKGQKGRAVLPPIK